MSDTQGRLDRAYYALIDVENAKRKVDRAYEQALAEETWEYSYQELRGDEWETAFNDVTHLEEWWPKKSDVDWIVEEARKHGYVCRLVRRRVSPPEVVSE